MSHRSQCCHAGDPHLGSVGTGCRALWCVHACARMCACVCVLVRACTHEHAYRCLCDPWPPPLISQLMSPVRRLWGGNPLRPLLLPLTSPPKSHYQTWKITLSHLESHGITPARCGLCCCVCARFIRPQCSLLPHPSRPSSLSSSSSSSSSSASASSSSSSRSS